MVSRPEGWLPDIPSTYWWPCILIQQFLHTLSPIPPSLNHFPPTFFHLHLSHNLLLLHPAWILAFALQPPDVLTLHASIGVFHKYSTARVVNIAIRLNLFASAHVHPLPAPALLVSLKGLSSAHYFFDIHFTHLYHCSLTQGLSAAIRRWHTTVCGSVTC